MKRRFIFISYSWDSDEHKAWVKKFSDDLQTGLGAEYEVLLDQDQPKGTDFGLFMQRGITMAEKVMIIGTTKYKEKSQKKLNGGVAYEGSIIREEKIAHTATTKFYTILREGTFSSSFPPGLGNTFGDDLSNDEKYDELLASIVEEIKNPKPISGIFKPDENDKKNNNIPKSILEQDRLPKSNIEQTEYGLIFTIGNVSFKMIRVEGGTFMMGADKQDSEAWDDERPPHHVCLSPYYIGETAVTQSLWETVMGKNKKNPSCFKGPNKPVENVNWKDCQEFIEVLIAFTGKEFRLPTEAEWEFAARGGNGHSKYKYSGSDDINEVAWYDYNSYDKGKSSPDYGSHDVKSKNPNELGIYDMSGNVWEWCNDWYDDKYYTISPHTNPQGPQNGNRRVYRGGSWSYNSRRCRVSNRGYFAPGIRYDNLGFRLALSEQIMIFTNEKDPESTEDNDKSVVKNKASHIKKLEVGIPLYDNYNLSSFLDGKKEIDNSIIGVEFSVNKKMLTRFPKDRIGEFIIPNHVDEIADDAFRDCNNLTSIVIPESVIKIGVRAFRGSTSLTSIKIPESVTEIGREAFRDCNNLTTIVIPESVIKIGVAAFENCTMLKEIHFKHKTPIDFPGAFWFLDGSKVSIYVPIGSGEAYRNNIYYERFVEIIEEE